MSKGLPRTPAEGVELLRAIVARSGLSNRKFAETQLVRDERTLRRWLAGDIPIPETVLRWLDQQNQNAAPLHTEREEAK